jgi:hypothetical protein
VTQKLRTPQHVEAVDILSRLGSCGQEYQWLRERSIHVAPELRTAEAAWADCPHGDWMVWLVSHGRVQRTIGAPALRLVACDIAELVLPAFEARYPKDSSPRAAVKTARRFARGRATAGELNEARRSASSASDRANADYFTSPDEDQQCAAFHAARAAVGAAETAADDAAYDSSDAAAMVDNSDKARRAWADIVRRHVPWATVRDALRPVAEEVRRANRDSKTIFNGRR